MDPEAFDWSRGTQLFGHYLAPEGPVEWLLAEDTMRQTQLMRMIQAESSGMCSLVAPPAIPTLVKLVDLW